MDGGGFNNRTRGLDEINTFLLMITFGNKASLMPFKGSINMVFVLKNLLAANDMHCGMIGNKRSSSIG